MGLAFPTKLASQRKNKFRMVWRFRRECKISTTLTQNKAYVTNSAYN